MLIDIKIKNYRSFRDEVTFSMVAEASKSKANNLFEVVLPNENKLRLVKIAIAYGSNASGKTNLIRAFYGFINYLINKPQVNSGVRMYDPFQFDKISNTQPTLLEINFVGPGNIKYSYQTTYNKDFIEYEQLDYYPSGKVTNLFKRAASTNEEENVHVGILGSYLSKKEIKVFSNQLLLSKFGDDEPIELLTQVFLYFKKYEVINSSNKAHHLYNKNQIDYLVFHDENLRKKLNNLLRFADTKLSGIQIFNIKSQDLSDELKIGVKEKVAPNPYMVLGLHNIYDGLEYTGENRQLSFENESTGTQVLYSIGGRVLLTLQTGGVLIVDEFDTSLHPYLTRMLVLMFQSEKLNPNNAQLIFTTHDMTLLDRELVRKDQVWIAEKNHMGVSELFSLQDFEGVREETPFDKWYLAGKFGGLPSIKSVDTMFEDDASNA